MEQSPGRNSTHEMPRAVAHGSLPPEYWNSLDSMYSDPQLQSQTPAEQDPTSQQAPMGIDWNHPIFQQQQQPNQQRSHLTPQTEPNHGIYSSIPQSWQPNPLQQHARGYPVSSQYQTHQQAPQFQQGQMSFESRSLNPSESSAFPSYSYQPNYFHPQQLPVQDSFSGRPDQQQHQQSADFAAAGPQSSISRFSVPSGYPQDLLHNNTLDLTSDFPDPQTGVSQHHTIDPQFLNPTPQNIQTPTLQNNLLYGGPAEFQTSDGRGFNYYENAFSARPQVGMAGNAVRSPAGMCPSIIFFFSHFY